MKKLTRVLMVVIIFISLVAFLPDSITPVQAATTYRYTLNGNFNERGTREGAINATLYRPENTSITQEVNGTYVIDEPVEGIAFRWDLGFNESRIYYLRPDVNETIYIFEPDEPYFTYTISVLDYLGVSNGYIETLLNINGTDRVIERWTIDMVLNELPFTLSYGVVYKLRLVCDRGTSYFAPIYAGATQNVILPITSDLFPVTPTDIGDIVVGASRMNATYIQGYYYDDANQTNWVWMGVYELGSTTLIDSANTTGQALTFNWYDADPDESHLVAVIINHQVRGSLVWELICPKPFAQVNPWDVVDDLLPTTSLPEGVELSQVVAIGIIILSVTGFSNINMGMALISMVIEAGIFNYIGWLDMADTALTVSISVAIMVAFAVSKGDG